MRILATMKRSPTGVMVIPLLLGCVVNVFFPNAPTIGGFTSGLFKNGVPTLTGLLLLCSGATIDVKMAGNTVWKGVVPTALKFFIGFGLGLLLNALFGETGFLGLAPLAVIGAVANSNGVIYATLTGEFGDETDVGAAFILALNDGPFFTMIVLDASGMGNFPIMDVIASIIPMVIGFIIGNLDHEWRKILATGMILLPPFSGFALGAGMNFNNILRVGVSGILLGLLTVLATGLLTFFLYSALRKKADPVGAAIDTTAGVATTTPTAVAMADPSSQSQVETVIARTAVAVIITAVLCPLLVSWLAKVSRKWNEAYNIVTDISAPEQGSCETQPAATADLDSLQLGNKTDDVDRRRKQTDTNRAILNAGMILCGEQLTPMENGSLIIGDGIIQEILPREARDALSIEGAEEISPPHMTLMPGMIEYHNHLCIDATLPEHLELLIWSNECQLTLLVLRGLKEDLMSGVTTARYMGDKYYIDVILKKLIEDGKVEGPRPLAAGIGMKGNHGAGHIGMPRCGTEETRRICREDLRKGADLLKLFITPGVPDPFSTFASSFLSLEKISIAVDEGTCLGIPTVAHCIGGQGLEDCIDGGVDVIEYIYMTTEWDVDRLASSRCVVDLTSGIFLDPSREEFLSPANALKVRQNRSQVRGNVSRIIKARLPFALGTDVYHDLLYREVGYAVELGIVPVTAIQGIISHAAKVCRLEDRTGELENGLEADITAVKGNPPKDVSRLSQVGLVMKGGVIYRQPQDRSDM